jgi:hypothetical protein
VICIHKSTDYPRLSTKLIPKKESCSIRDNLDPDSNATEESDLHLAKHSSPKTLTDAGIMTSITPIRQNAYDSIRDNLDSDSNVTAESDLHPEKQFSPKTSTDAVRVISTKPLPQNELGSIRDNLDPDSKITEESDLHS